MMSHLLMWCDDCAAVSRRNSLPSLLSSLSSSHVRAFGEVCFRTAVKGIGARARGKMKMGLRGSAPCCAYERTHTHKRNTTPHTYAHA